MFNRSQTKTKYPSEKSLWDTFSIYIRLRDAQPFTGLCECFTCGRIRHWRKGDCGHGIGRQHKCTKYDERNNHFQCKACNGFEGGQQAEYAKRVDKKYGAGTWDKMLIASRQTCKRNGFDRYVMRGHYQNEIERLLKEKKLSL